MEERDTSPGTSGGSAVSGLTSTVNDHTQTQSSTSKKRKGSETEVRQVAKGGQDADVRPAKQIRNISRAGTTTSDASGSSSHQSCASAQGTSDASSSTLCDDSPEPTGSVVVAPRSVDWYTVAIDTLLPFLPDSHTLSALFRIFWTDPFMPVGGRLLEPRISDALADLQRRRAEVSTSPCQQGDATTLTTAFIIMASSIYLLPKESRYIYLPSGSPFLPPGLKPYSHSSLTPTVIDRSTLPSRIIHHVHFLSPIADSNDESSVMKVFGKLLLLYRFAKLCSKTPTLEPFSGESQAPRPLDRIRDAGKHLVRAIHIAKEIGIDKNVGDLDLDDHQIRRHLRLALFVADETHALATALPKIIDYGQRSSWLQLLCRRREFDEKHHPSERFTGYLRDKKNPDPDAYLYAMASEFARCDIMKDVGLGPKEYTLPHYMVDGWAADTSHDFRHPHLRLQRIHLDAAKQTSHPRYLRSTLESAFGIGDNYNFEEASQELEDFLGACHNAHNTLNRDEVARIIDVDQLSETVAFPGLWLRAEGEVVKQSLQTGHRPHEEDGEDQVRINDQDHRESFFQQYRTGYALLESLSRWPEYQASANRTLTLLRQLDNKLRILGLTATDGWPAESEIGRVNPEAKSTWQEAWVEAAKPIRRLYQKLKLDPAAPWNPDPVEWANICA